MDRLPIGYRELPYIESTGTQWIDTGLRLSTALYRFVFDLIPTSLTGSASSNYSGIMGANSTPQVGFYSGGWTTGNAASSTPYTPNPGTKYHIEYSKNGIGDYWVDGVDTGIRRSGTMTCNLFWVESRPNNAKVKLFAASIISLSDGQKVLDLVPCKRLSDGAIGMYDLVSQAFFGNSGTGEFIAGAPVIEPTWGSGVSQVSRKLLMRRDSLVADANAMYFGKSVQNGTPSIRNRVDIVDSTLKKVGDHLYPYVGTLPVPLRGVRLGASVPSAYESVGGIYFDGTDYWCADTYEPSKGRYIQRIREVVMTGTAPYNVGWFYNQLTKTFLVYNYYSALTSGANDLSAASYGPLCNYAAADRTTIFYGDYEHIGNFENSRITFCVRYPFDYWGIASGEKTSDELIALVNALLKERYEAGVPYILRYVLRNPIVSIL